jgi:glycerol uptake facilitator protein
MNALIGEIIGTALLILLGNGVVAGVVLNQSKAQNSGWIVITVGWGLAVAMAAFLVGSISGAHLNPALTLALAAAGKFEWGAVPGYIGAQMLGAIIGAVLVYLQYLPHWEKTEDKGGKLACFATAPAIRHTTGNFISEFIGTFVLVCGILAIPAEAGAGYKPLVVAALIVSIGLSLGGSTGYAINPARDLGPRIAHAFLPIAGKGDSDWGYAWIPVIAPILGGIAGGLFYVNVVANLVGR